MKFDVFTTTDTDDYVLLQANTLEEFLTKRLLPFKVTPVPEKLPSSFQILNENNEVIGNISCEIDDGKITSLDLGNSILYRQYYNHDVKLTDSVIELAKLESQLREILGTETEQGALLSLWCELRDLYIDRPSSIEYIIAIQNQILGLLDDQATNIEKFEKFTDDLHKTSDNSLRLHISLIIVAITGLALSVWLGLISCGICVPIIIAGSLTLGQSLIAAGVSTFTAATCLGMLSLSIYKLSQHTDKSDSLRTFISNYKKEIFPEFNPKDNISMYGNSFNTNNEDEFLNDLKK